MGERALLIRRDDTRQVLALYEQLRQSPLAHQRDLVPAAESLLVHLDKPVGEAIARLAAEICAAIRRSAAAGATAEATAVVIDVVYDGPDLDGVAELTGLGVDGVIRAHTGAAWRVAFCGFAPGFAYLTGGTELEVPRLASPRARIPAGSVGLAGAYSGIYPTASPGGWQLIGRTDAPLWDVRREPPALLRPGMSVRFRPVRERAVAGAVAGRMPGAAVDAADGAAADGVRHAGDGAAESASRATASQATGPGGDDPRGGLTVQRTGAHCLIQDRGRTGYGDIGVSPSGAADRAAAARANALVGNDPDAAVLEFVLGGAEIAFDSDAVIAVTGADCRPGWPMDAAHDVSAGTRVRLRVPRRGLRSYLAVRGGIDVPPVLGSRCTDVLAGLGPAPVRAGDHLAIGSTAVAEQPIPPADGGGAAPAVTPPPTAPDGPPAGAETATDGPAAGAPIPSTPPTGVTVLRILPGPQHHWFAADALERLAAATWTVSPDSNRVALRLTGPAPERIVMGELPSQGLVRGAIQVPPSGELVVFLADYPVTGGYPVIAVLDDASADATAQLRPGASVIIAR